MIKHSSLLRSVAVASLIGVAGCSTMPREKPTVPPLPASWSEAATYYPSDAPSVTSWWEAFKDPTLNQLIDEGLERSPNVRQAMTRVKESRAQSAQTFGAFLPQVDAQARGNFTRDVNGPDADFGTGSYGAAISWEIPLLGRIQAAAIGSRANKIVALADERGAKATLTADLSQAYVDLRTAQNRRVALAEAADISREVARLTRISADAGFASEADAEDARRQAESTIGQLPDVEIEMRRAINQIAVLRAYAPGADQMTATLAERQDVPTIALTSAPAAPADLIRLRPDVASAEANAIVAAAQVGAARQDILPRLSLTGSILSSQILVGNVGGSSTFSGEGTTASLTPLISIPLLDWGQRFAAIRARKAQFERALINYESTINQGVSEASIALTQLTQGIERLRSARAAEEAAEKTARGVRASYGAGIASLTDRLRSDQQLLDARLRRIQAESQQAAAAIAVYRAFGGGPPEPGMEQAAREQPISAAHAEPASETQTN
jgi:NodT family efflux transporter outer membrane factor (OMF) lipoprotein